MKTTLHPSFALHYMYPSLQPTPRPKPNGRTNSSFGQAQATAEALSKSIPRTIRRQQTSATVSAANSTARKFIGETNNSKSRHRTTLDQQVELEKAYMDNEMPNAAMRQVIADRLSMPVKSVHIWFQNRRAKARMEEKSKEQHINGATLPTQPEQLLTRRASMASMPLPANAKMSPMHPQPQVIARPPPLPPNQLAIPLQRAAILPRPQMYYTSLHYEPYHSSPHLTDVAGQPRLGVLRRPRSNSYQSLFERRYREQLALLRRQSAAGFGPQFAPHPPQSPVVPQQRMPLPPLVNTKPRPPAPLANNVSIQQQQTSPDRSYYTYAPDPALRVRLPGISEIIPKEVLAAMDANAK